MMVLGRRFSTILSSRYLIKVYAEEPAFCIYFIKYLYKTTNWFLLCGYVCHYNIRPAKKLWGKGTHLHKIIGVILFSHYFLY